MNHLKDIYVGGPNPYYSATGSKEEVLAYMMTIAEDVAEVLGLEAKIFPTEGEYDYLIYLTEPDDQYPVLIFRSNPNNQSYAQRYFSFTLPKKYNRDTGYCTAEISTWSYTNYDKMEQNISFYYSSSLPMMTYIKLIDGSVAFRIHSNYEYTKILETNFLLTTIEIDGERHKCVMGFDRNSISIGAIPKAGIDNSSTAQIPADLITGANSSVFVFKNKSILCNAKMYCGGLEYDKRIKMYSNMTRYGNGDILKIDGKKYLMLLDNSSNVYNSGNYQSFVLELDD